MWHPRSATIWAAVRDADVDSVVFSDSNDFVAFDTFEFLDLRDSDFLMVFDTFVFLDSHDSEFLDFEEANS